MNYKPYKHGDTTDIIYQFIVSFIDEHGFAPTIREIVEGIHVKSTSVVKYHLDKLEHQNRITRKEGVARSIIPVGGDQTSGFNQLKSTLEENKKLIQELSDLAEKLKLAEKKINLLEEQLNGCISGHSHESGQRRKPSVRPFGG